jgi:hypothetical protein
MMPNELLTLQHLHSDSATGFEPRWRLPAALTLPPPSPLHTQPASRLGPFAQTKAEIVDSNQLDRDPTPHPPFPNENLKDTKHSNMLGSNVKVWRESNRVGAYLEGRLLRRSTHGEVLPQVGQVGVLGVASCFVQHGTDRIAHRSWRGISAATELSQTPLKRQDFGAPDSYLGFQGRHPLQLLPKGTILLEQRLYLCKNGIKESNDPPKRQSNFQRFLNMTVCTNGSITRQKEARRKSRRWLRSIRQHCGRGW